ncbi:toll/interleukin-1 receptor domain-containing protein [Dyadobacter sp. CY343]|uniref:toll/interleukin-1 receptor domain-containing protein n=1 Tax=Dyadobacter sp. CY343 TaxID=2907299 RepID=UPI001F369AB1|nr:toll/interleukin-1 receptor domain-containing protein [Dyadobacter sp. CY343]MCE7061919.1 toll/interleukin-1 receptor domain-containing protein [Dyadobacter sp. CY343]
MNNDLEPVTEFIPTVFISYSHDDNEHKAWVLRLAVRLRDNGVNVLIDQINLRLGSNLAIFMEQGLTKANRVICICSENYVAKADNSLGGVGYEKNIISAAMMSDQNSSWVIPIIRNNCGIQKMPVVLANRLYLSFEEERLYESNYETLLRDLLDEPVYPARPVGKNPFKNIPIFTVQKFLPRSEKYISPATSGSIEFDYSNNDGFYAIGVGELMFECHFTRAGTGAIHMTSNGPSIYSLSQIKQKTEISKISDASRYDTSSKTRLFYSGHVAIYQNKSGFYAAIKLRHIDAATHPLTWDSVYFDYVIQTNGTPNFLMPE